MKFIPMAELLQDASTRGYAVPSFCVWSAEVMVEVLRVATDLRAPVIIMAGPCEFSLLTPTFVGGIAHAIADQFSLPAALHLDHGDSLEQVKDCLDAGFSSVMLDYSTRPFAENATALRQVAEMARPLGVTVEGELGHVGKADTVTMEGDGDSTLTLPEEAAEYLALTGVDALAVSIGNAHGQYTRLPKFDFTRLEQIRAITRIPLVLHGGSGTPEADIQRAISLGMAKINIATELTLAFRAGLQAELGAPTQRWLPLSMADAAEYLVPVVEKWIRLTGATGRA